MSSGNSAALMAGDGVDRPHRRGGGAAPAAPAGISVERIFRGICQFSPAFYQGAAQDTREYSSE